MRMSLEHLYILLWFMLQLYVLLQFILTRVSLIVTLTLFLCMLESIPWINKYYAFQHLTQKACHMHNLVTSGIFL